MKVEHNNNNNNNNNNNYNNNNDDDDDDTDNDIDNNNNNKDMEDYTNQIPGNISIHELQKITLLSTAHLPGRFLSIK